MIYLNNSKLVHHIGEWFVPEDIEHIAFRLSHINRFNGSVGAYSVAQHSVLVAEMLPPEHQLAGLLHDVSEAYIGDITRPLKDSGFVKGYEELESFYDNVIDNHYGVETGHPLVKEADRRMVVTEAESFGMPTEHFAMVGNPYDFTVQRMPAEEAALQFVLAYKRLRHGIES